MPFIACGINYQTSPIALRERAFITPEHAPALLRDLLQKKAANEAMILSTCNRTELYGYTHDFGHLQQWLANQPQLQAAYHSDSWYWLQDEQAVKHMMQVSSGLKSMMLGEPQIKGQMRSAFEVAKAEGAVGSYLQRLLQAVFAVSKQVRTASGLGVSPISVAYVAASLAKRIFANIPKCCVLLIGSGQTIELTAMHLAEQGVKRMIIANRSLTKATKLAEPFAATAIQLEDIPVYLQQADIVVSATSSPTPILGKGLVERTIKIGRRKPRLMIDLAVPRDIEPEIAELEDIYLYHIDHLQEMVQENLKSRQRSAEMAAAMIDTQAKYFMRQLQVVRAADTIASYRNKVNDLRDTVFKQGLQALQQGETPATVLNNVLAHLANKIMHAPTIHMRQAAFDGQLELLLYAQRLLDL
ncbi:MAG: glutamyl-tRNA reductase [Gammaproteobacteria bacterium]